MANTEILLGYEWDPETGHLGEPDTFDLSSSHFTVIGPTRCGKDATLGIPNAILRMHGMSLIDLDTTGQGAAVCGQARVDAGSELLPLNPMGLHVEQYPDLASVGCNVLVEGVDPKSPRFYEEAAAIADAFEWSDKGDPFWSNAGRDYANSLIMHVRKRDGDAANLSTVLQLMMEHEEIDADGRPTKGPRFTAAEMVATGHFQIAALAGRFLSNASPKTIDSIRQTAQTAARSLLSDPIRADLAKTSGIWEKITEKPVYVPIILPAEDTEFHRVWLRLIVSCGLNVIYRKAGNVKVLTVLRLPEFFALGPLRSVQAAMGQAAKYGVRVWSVLQDIGQLQSMFGKEGAETFIANSGCIFAFTPGDNNSAELLSRYGGEHAIEHVSLSDDPITGQPRVNVDVRYERLWPAHKIRSIPRFHGLVWKFGSSVPQPVACRPYFEDEECLRLARPDPYYKGTPSAEQKPGGRSRGKLVMMAAAALLAALTLLRSNTVGDDRETGLTALRPPVAAPVPLPPPHVLKQGRRF